MTKQHPQRQMFAALGVVVTSSSLTKAHWPWSRLQGLPHSTRITCQRRRDAALTPGVPVPAPCETLRAGEAPKALLQVNTGQVDVPPAPYRALPQSTQRRPQTHLPKRPQKGTCPRPLQSPYRTTEPTVIPQDPPRPHGYTRGAHRRQGRPPPNPERPPSPGLRTTGAPRPRSHPQRTARAAKAPHAPRGPERAGKGPRSPPSPTERQEGPTSHPRAHRGRGQAPNRDPRRR